MRFVRVIVVLALIGSLGLNVIAVTKWRSRRPILTVNGQSLTKKDIDDYLEQQAGPNVKAVLVQRILIEQEAKRLGVWPSDADVEEAYVALREANWQVARQIMNNPWQANETKANIRYNLAQQRILTKDVPVTEEEIKEEYNTNAARYDTPNKARVNLALVLNEGQFSDIKQLMQKKNPPVSPSVIMQNYRGGVVFLGYDNIYTFGQALNNPKDNAIIFGMKPGDVKDFPPQEFGRMGAKRIIVRMDKIEPGKKANMNDPKIKDRIRMAVAARRAKPWSEYLSGLWANVKFESENPDDKKNVEMLLFPERARAEASK
jgi:hypothetical protein